MTRFSPDDPIPTEARGCALALGNFDGVHLGHVAVLAAAMEAADAAGVAPAAGVFEPHTRRLFQPDALPFRLQSAAQRARALAEAGAAHVFELRFDRAVAQLSDAEFTEQVLVERLGATQVSVGAQFRFGRQRMGDAASLAALGKKLGFGVAAVPELADATGSKISSTAVRAAIAKGDMETAARMLGRSWAIEGVVERGFARGRTLGFATANVKLGDYVRPLLGIYAVRADLGDGSLHAGVASIGVNPTFGALSEPVLEAHLFDFDADLYGRTIEVELIAFMREEARFETAEALARQIAEDVAAARSLLTPP